MAENVEGGRGRPVSLNLSQLKFKKTKFAAIRDFPPGCGQCAATPPVKRIKRRRLKVSGVCDQVGMQEIGGNAGDFDDEDGGGLVDIVKNCLEFYRTYGREIVVVETGWAYKLYADKLESSVEIVGFDTMG